MSKFLTKITSICFGLLLLLSQVSYAASVVMDLDIDGKVTKYDAEEIFIKVDGIDVVTKEMPPIIINERTLVPAREMFETMGAQVDWDNDLREAIVTFSDSKVNIKINSEIAKVTKGEETKDIVMDVVAKIINNKTMIPFRAVSEALGYTVEWVQETRTILITSPSGSIVANDIYEKVFDDESEDDNLIEGSPVPEAIEKNALEWDAEAKSIIEETKLTREENSMCNIVSEKIDIRKDYAILTIKSDGPMTEVVHSTLDNRIIIDIKNSKRVIDEKITYDDNPYFESLRSSQYEIDATRCVIDIKPLSMPYSLSFNKSRTELNVKVYKNEILNVNYNETNKKATFVIKTASKVDGEFIRLTNPDRIYIDLKNTKSYFGTKYAQLKNSKFVSEIKTSEEDDYVRFTLVCDGQYDFEMTKIDDCTIKLVMSDSGYDEEVVYSNYDEYQISIPTSLVNNSSSSNVEIIEDYMNGIYEIKFDRNYSSLGKGKLKVNDFMLDSFEILKDGGVSTIRFNPKDHKILAFEVSKEKSNIIISIMLPGEKYNEVLILDAGHGDGNQGTSDKKYTGYSSDKKNIYYEDDMNLAIVTSAYNYLNDNSNIKVYLTRESNKKFNDYISNYPEESTSARLLNGRTGMKLVLDADAFLSVHINAMGDPKNGKWETNVQGTEIWYNNKINEDGDNYNGLSNKIFAREMIDGFVEYSEGNYENKNGEITDGYIETSSSLAVLRDGKMPSALIEIGYINNEIDHENLLDPNYLKKAGESLAKTIIDIFDDYRLNKNRK